MEYPTKTRPVVSDPPRCIAGRYVLGEILGVGGMSTVYAATDLLTKSPVAVKMIDLRNSQHRWVLKRLELGARMAKQLRHPNIVHLLDLGSTADGAFFVVLERLEGHDLGEMITEQPLSWRWARHMMGQVCAGMAEIHAAGLVHCDLKPSNCFYVTKSARVELLDFGLLRSVGQPVPEGTVLGTPAYIAPERIRSQPFDRRADIYAAGVTLFELLTGRRPYLASSTGEVLDQHLHAAPPKLADIVRARAVPAALDEVIARAMATDPRDRYGSMAELWAALEGVEPDSIVRRRVRRHASVHASASNKMIPRMRVAHAPTLRIPS